MFLIRSKTSKSFGRSGVLFAALTWLLVANPTVEQREEKQLEVVSVEKRDIADGTFRGFPVVNVAEPLVMPDPEPVKPDGGASVRLEKAEEAMRRAIAEVSQEDALASLARLADAAKAACATPADEPTPVNPRVAELMALKMSELKPIADELGLTVAVGATKDATVGAIVAAEEAKAATPAE